MEIIIDADIDLSEVKEGKDFVLTLYNGRWKARTIDDVLAEFINKIKGYEKEIENFRSEEAEGKKERENMKQALITYGLVKATEGGEE